MGPLGIKNLWVLAGLAMSLAPVRACEPLDKPASKPCLSVSRAAILKGLVLSADALVLASVDDDDEDIEAPGLDDPKRDAAPKSSLPAPLRNKRVEDRKRQPPQSVLPLAEQRNRVLDELFSRLTSADPRSAAPIAASIERVWSRSGSDTADLLLRRAQTAFAADQKEAALRLMDAAVELAPRWAFAFVQRAAIREALDENKGAQDDLEAAIALDPRQFAAYANLGVLLLRNGQKRSALESFRKSLAINPGQPKIKQRIETLAPDVEGRDI